MRFQFIHAHRTEFTVSAMCRVLDVTRPGYYAWCAREESRRSREDRRLRVKIRAVHQEKRGAYGSPRVYLELRKDGEETCGRHRVARLMREEGLVGKKGRKFRTTTQSDPRHPVAPNLLRQNFEVEKPDRVWSGDITYLRTREGWLYLAVLLDLCTRMVVGWSLSTSLSQNLTLATLRKAVRSRRPGPGLIHHSDRGSQYTSDDYREALEELGMVASMSRKGNCWDNAPVESFFDSLKTEIGIDVFDTRHQAKAVVFEYIEVFCNRQRMHSSLDYLSPAEYEKQLAA